MSPHSANERPDLTMILSELAFGGIGKMRAHLMNEFSARGLKVHLVLGKADSPYRDLIGAGVRVFDNRTSHALFGVPRLARHLHAHPPSVILAQRIRVNVLAHRARRLAGIDAPLYATLNTNLTRQFNSMEPAKAHKQRQQLRTWYTRNDGLIAVSQGVADDLGEHIDYPAERLHVVPNPVVTGQLYEQARETPDHPWLAESTPVILAVGRLQPQKDFPTLLRAFARIRARRELRLVILGTGPDREALLTLADSLGIAADVDLPGFTGNPYAFMSRARMLVMSSAWEGLGNVLIESLAVGTPVVSTDCPSGPSEILDGGRYGPLVPVGNDDQLAVAIEATLDSPLPEETLRAAAGRYTLERSADAYLEAMGFADRARGASST